MHARSPFRYDAGIKFHNEQQPLVGVLACQVRARIHFDCIAPLSSPPATSLPRKGNSDDRKPTYLRKRSCLLHHDGEFFGINRLASYNVPMTYWRMYVTRWSGDYYRRFNEIFEKCADSDFVELPIERHCMNQGRLACRNKIIHPTEAAGTETGDLQVWRLRIVLVLINLESSQWLWKIRYNIWHRAHRVGKLLQIYGQWKRHQPGSIAKPS